MSLSNEVDKVKLIKLSKADKVNEIKLIISN